MKQVVKYIVSGGSGAVANIGSFFILTHVCKLWYLASSVVAFILSFFVSFTLQRFWTFEHRSRSGLTRHAALYFVVAIANLALNTGIVFSAVQYLHIEPIIAQILAGVFVSITSYFIYAHLVFAQKEV